eukprot:9502-Rhodomonas_salina.2
MHTKFTLINWTARYTLIDTPRRPPSSPLAASAAHQEFTAVIRPNLELGLCSVARYAPQLPGTITSSYQHYSGDPVPSYSLVSTTQDQHRYADTRRQWEEKPCGVSEVFAEEACAR